MVKSSITRNLCINIKEKKNIWQLEISDGCIHRVRKVSNITIELTCTAYCADAVERAMENFVLVKRESMTLSITATWGFPMSRD